MNKTVKLFRYLLMLTFLLPHLAQASDLLGSTSTGVMGQEPHTGLSLDSSGDLTSLCFSSKNGVTSYLGAGVALETDEETTYSLGTTFEENSDLPYRLGAGIDCSLSEHTSLDVDYRFNTGELSNLGDVFDLGDTDRRDNHQVSVGLRVAF